MSVGERIKKLRTNAKMSQTELADSINVTKQTIYKYENNIITNIPYDKLKAMADIFHVSPSYLLAYNTSPDYFVSIDGVNYCIEVKSTTNHTDLYKRIFALTKFIQENPEYCDLFESVQKIDKDDISLLTELIKKITH